MKGGRHKENDFKTAEENVGKQAWQRHNMRNVHSLPLGKARTLMTKKNETTTNKPTLRLLSGCSSSLNNTTSHVNKG